MSHLIQDPIFWVATAFIAFILVLVYLKIPLTVGTKLDKRADKIKADLDEAEALYKEAQDLLAAYQSYLAAFNANDLDEINDRINYPSAYIDADSVTMLDQFLITQKI